MPSVIGLISRTYNTLNKRFARVAFPLFERCDGMALRLESLGEGDGAWIVPLELIIPGAICYCVGVGVNATFDVALAARSGTAVFAFDPTPRTVDYMRALDPAAKGITFLPVGVWNSDTTLRFYAPMNRRHANFSVRDIHGTAEYFTAECHRMSSIMTRLGHSHVDLVKIDIEGAWYEVVSNMIEERSLPDILCVEFDTPTSLFKVLTTVRRLRAAGLSLVHRDRDNYLFVNPHIVPGR
jgi:FkbM family methyltransferase